MVGVSNDVKDHSDDVVHAYIAVIKGEVAGFVYGFVLPNGVLLPQYLYLKPKFRGKGMGKELLSFRRGI